MDTVEQLFDRMDAWRHLPNYQLERRADLFFSLYLSEALAEELGFAMGPHIIPEFPVRVGTIYPDTPINKSFKIDYLLLDASAKQAVFVELKTEGRSRRPEQDRYLLAAKEAGLPALLGGILHIFRATTAKRKYFLLLDSLSRMGLLELPSSMREDMQRDRLQGVTRLSDEVKITCDVKTCHIVYVQPTGKGPGIISFDGFRKIVERRQDPISKRFARSLREWAKTPAGMKHLGG